MKCNDVSELILQLAAGALSEDELSRIEAHVQDCPRCRGELEGTRWLREGFLANRARIEEGHVSSMLLYEFVRSPEDLEQDTVAMVRAHVERCDGCRADLAAVEELARIPLTVPRPVRASDSAIPRWLGRFGNWRAAAVTTAVVIVGTWWIVSRTTGPTGPAFEWSDAEPAYASLRSHELPVSLVTRGVSEHQTDARPEIDPESRTVLLVMDLPFLEESGFAYEVVVSDFAGAEIWRDDVPETAVDDTRIVIQLDARGLDPETYTIELIETESDGFSSVIAESGFTIEE